MSTTLLSYLSTLFGREDRSDCTVLFYINQGDSPGKETRKRRRSGSADSSQGEDEEDEHGSPEPPATVGDPLPAHQLVLCGGSPRFAAQADRWVTERGPGTKPELRVPLGSQEELPYAMAALQYIYSGKLDVNTTEGLLKVRRLAAYLQVEGCVEACGAALTARVTATPLAGVTELYGCRTLLADAADDPSTASLLRACRQQLAKHGATGAALLQLSLATAATTGGTKNAAAAVSGTAAGAVAAPLAAAATSAGAVFSEMLAWAFRDAPSLLSDPEARQQMQALPAAALEALLRSDTFATDDEATVLLMLACWLEANGAKTPDVWRQQLFRLVRLVQLNPTYLHSVLALGFIAPALPVFKLWYPLTREEHVFLCQYAAEQPSRRASLAAAAAGRYDCASPWYGTTQRPHSRCDAGRPYEWFVRQEELAAKLVSREAEVWVYGTFTNGATRLVSQGFEWYPALHVRKGAPAVGVYLNCAVPSALRVPNPGALVGVTHTAARLVVHRWREDGSREEAHRYTFSHKDNVQVGKGLGFHSALPLATTTPPAGTGTGTSAADGRAAAAAAAVTAGGSCGATQAGSSSSVTAAVAAAVAAAATAAAATGSTGSSGGSQLLAGWVPYLRNGKLTGTLTWL